MQVGSHQKKDCKTEGGEIEEKGGSDIYGPSRMGELVEGETSVEKSREFERKSRVGFMRWQTATDEKRTNASVFLAALPVGNRRNHARTCLLGATRSELGTEREDDDAWSTIVIVVILLH